MNFLEELASGTLVDKVDFVELLLKKEVCLFFYV